MAGEHNEHDVNVGGHDEYETLSSLKSQNGVTLGLALLAGVGMVILLIVGGIGVIEGPNANDDTFGVLSLVGLMLFIGGTIGWAAVARPWERFPDVTEGYYDKPEPTAHDDDEHHDGQDALPENTAHNHA